MLMRGLQSKPRNHQPVTLIGVGREEVLGDARKLKHYKMFNVLKDNKFNRSWEFLECGCFIRLRFLGLRVKIT